MRIGISAKGPDSGDFTEERFGRAPYFLIFDREAGSWTAVPNPMADDVGGVGPRAVQILVDHDVDVLITGRVGGNARRALESAGITVYICLERVTAASAYGMYEQGTLKQLK